MAIPFIRDSAAAHLTDMVRWYLGSSVDTAGRLTDLNVGSNLRNILEAVAVRFEYLDTKAWAALLRAIPTMLFDIFGFTALPALPASGVVTLVRAPGSTGLLTLPLGTRFQVAATTTSPARIYVTTVPVTMAEATLSGEVPVQATAAGAFTNTPAQTLGLVNPILGLGVATNVAALINGADAETDERRRQRFAAFIRELARCQYAGLERGALTAQIRVAGIVIEQALYARAVPRAGKRGLVDVYLDNGGGTASALLLAEAQRIVDGYRLPDGTHVVGYKASGEVVVLKPVTPVAVGVGATIVLEAGFAQPTVFAAVTQAVTAYIAELGVFRDLVLADLIATIALVRGVKDVRIATPAANVLADSGGRLVPGAVLLTEAAA